MVFTMLKVYQTTNNKNDNKSTFAPLPSPHNIGKQRVHTNENCGRSLERQQSAGKQTGY